MDLMIFPELARAAILQKQSKSFRFWTVARALDEKGRGYVSVKQMEEIWPQSKSNLSRIMREGEGTWWNKNDGRLFLRSTLKSGMALKTQMGCPSWYSFEECSTIGKFHTACFAAWFVIPRTISLGTLTNLFGVSAQTIRNWAKRSGLKVSPNIASYEITPDNETTIHGGGTWYSGGFCFFQMPNTYSNPRAACCPRHRRTEKKLREALNMDKGHCQKLYFEDDKDACRALQAGRDRIFVRERRDTWHHSNLWTYYVK